MTGEFYGPGVLWDRPADGLSYPPGGIGGKSFAAVVVITKDRAHQTNTALLDEVGKGQSSVSVAPGNGVDQTEVGGDQDVFGRFDFEGHGHEAVAG